MLNFDIYFNLFVKGDPCPFNIALKTSLVFSSTQ